MIPLASDPTTNSSIANPTFRCTGRMSKFELPTVIGEREKLLVEGINRSEKTRSILPLLRSLEIILRQYSRPERDGYTLFACDSFCEPHFRFQQKFIQMIDRVHPGRADYLDLPAAHFLLSDPSLGRRYSQAINLESINSTLLTQKQEWLREPQHNIQATATSCTFTKTIQYLTEVLDSIPGETIKDLYILGQNIDLFTYRDLALSYKITPEDIHACGSEYKELFYFSRKIMIWTLSRIVLCSGIGKTCFYMSCYSASILFHFYCTSTGRIARYIEPTGIDRHTNLSEANHVRIMKTPADRVLSYQPTIIETLNGLRLGNNSCTYISDYISQRSRGEGVHTYSQADNYSEALKDPVFKSIEDFRNTSNGNIVIAFTSSDDENTGAKILDEIFYKNKNWLTNPCFQNQEEWLCTLIDYFGTRRANDALVIRIHPRMWSDKRGLGVSPRAPGFVKMLFDKCEKFPNIFIVHPSSPLSSYTLGYNCDLVLNGSSTIGYEMAIRNVRVVNAFSGTTVPGGYVYPAPSQIGITSQAHYLKTIEDLLHDNELHTRRHGRVISKDEAAKAILFFENMGMVDMNDQASLLSQISEPRILTRELIALIMR